MSKRIGSPMNEMKKKKKREGILFYNVRYCKLYSATAENTDLLCKGKYHCMTDLLFDWFGFDRTCKCLSNSTQPNQMNPNQSNRRLAMQ